MNIVAFRAGLLTAALISGLLTAPLTALAHKVSIFAWVEAGQVHTESKFNGGRKVNAGKIEVFDHEENKVLDGVTNAEGYFAFPVPGNVNSLRIVLKAGMGHGNHWIVNAQELGAAAPTTAPAKAGGSASETDTPMGVNLSPLNDASIERIVERVLDKKLAPIKAQMADQAWGLRDILSGLGYILGLVGLASYLQNRKQRPIKP